MKKILTLCLILLGAISVYAKETRQFTVTTTPKMSCQNCVKKIEGNLRFEKGVKKVEAILDEQTVIVTYDPEKTDEKKLEQAFGKLNYKVTPKKADAKKSCDGKHNGKKGCDGKHGGTNCDGKHKSK